MNSKDILEQAKSQINILEYIQMATNTKAKKVGKTYFINPCPFCGHKDHFSITAEKNLFKSFSGCRGGGSIVDFIMQYENLNLSEAINKVINISGLSKYEESYSKFEKRESTTSATELVVEEGIVVNDNTCFNNLIEKLHSNVGQTDYYYKRGLTDKTINKYKLGFSDSGFNFAIKESCFLNEKESKIFEAYKYFLPIWSSDGNCRYFICRLDENSIPEGLDKLNKTHNLKGYSAKLFNDRYLENKGLTNNLIFIVEGIFDALSLEEIDYNSIALNSVNNADLLIKRLNENIEILKYKTFVLIYDNDESGVELKTKLIRSFKDLGLNLEICNIPEVFKDANEFLQNDRNEFTKYILKFIEELNNMNYNIAYLDKFLNEIQESKNMKVISTGFKGLDYILGGGLFPGLYTIGAISSLGKTTLVLQTADSIALSGSDVIYFSLEMGKNELVRKSLSREMFMIDSNKAVTSRYIMQGKFDNEIFFKAMDRYKIISNNISIVEGGFEIGVEEIRNMVKRNISIRGKKPVVIVDYFQILKAFSNKMSDKQANDFNISALKKISRDFDIPVIAISSLNRTNYTATVGFESFKETGAIEYSSDVVIGLQLKGIDNIATLKTETEKRNRINELKAKYPREIELITIKQRDGVSFAKQDFRYFSKYNFFLEEDR